MFLKRIFLSFFAITVCVAEDRVKKTAQPDKSYKIFGYTVKMLSEKQRREFAIGFCAGATQQLMVKGIIAVEEKLHEKNVLDEKSIRTFHNSGLVGLGTFSLMQKALKATGHESKSSRWGSVVGQVFVGSVSLKDGKPNFSLGISVGVMLNIFLNSGLLKTYDSRKI